MYRYTTPSLTLKLEGLDFDEVLLFRVAIEQKNIELLKVVEVSDPGVDAENSTIVVSLTQEETAQFKESPVEIQVRIKLTNGKVLATNKVKRMVSGVLDEVII